MNDSPNGLDDSGNVADPDAWLASNPSAPRWLREMVETLCPPPAVAKAPRINLDDDGTLDDFAAWGVKMVHFEAMDQSQWCLTVELDNGDVWQLRFGARNDRALGYAFAEQVS